MGTLEQIQDKAMEFSRHFDVMKLRNDIYLGQGYHVIRDYLNRDQVQHMVSFWEKNSHQVKKKFNKEKHLSSNCENVTHIEPGLVRHYGYFWAKPRDMFTYVTAWRMQSLRNQIEGRTPNYDFHPHHKKNGSDPRNHSAASYRIVMTKNQNAVEPHRDWRLDHSRVQLLLMLTSSGEDYDGGLFIYDDRTDGHPVNICKSENLQAGDLLIFGYARKHGVFSVNTTKNQRGYYRLMIPLETIPVRKKITPMGIYRWFRWRIRNLHRLSNSPIEPTESSTSHSYYDREVGELMSIAIKEGFEPAEVYFYRGLWGRFHMFTNWQVEFLREAGLRPEHKFLDIGCGCLRLGMKMIPYLNEGNYYGIDPVDAYLELGKIYMSRVVNEKKDFELLCDGNFNFSEFGERFDFAMAQSVFTHLSYSQIAHCLKLLQKVMEPGGKLIFTISWGIDNEESFVYVYNMPMTKSSHKSMLFYDKISEELGIEIELIKNASHPTQQVCIATF